MSRIPVRRRAVQTELVCAFDRLHAHHHVAIRDFCAALALSERTFRSWRRAPVAPPSPPPPATKPCTKTPPDRATGRFALEVTAPETQLGSDTTDLRVLGVDLKLVGAQDLGDRERRLFDDFAIDEHETAGLIAEVVSGAVDGRDGLQLITDQGKPFLAEAARDAYDALAVEHAPQREGTPTAKATVERAFGTVKGALAPLLGLLDRLAATMPSLRRADLARPLGMLLVAVFLRVYAAGRRHLGHPLEGHDPDALRAIIEEQRHRARAEDRSARLFLAAVHDEYAMPGSREAFVRAFRRYPLDDLHDAERRFRAYACRCQTRVCDRYFAAVVRDAHARGNVRRSADWKSRHAAADDRRARAAAAARTAHLDAHPEHRLHEGLDLLADTWRDGRFLDDARVARLWLQRAITLIQQREPVAAADRIETHVRAWQAARPQLPHALSEAVRGVLRQVLADIARPTSPNSPAASVAAILAASARGSTDNTRPSPSPHLRI